MKSNFTDFLHYIKYFLPSNKERTKQILPCHPPCPFGGPQKNHNFIYILPHEKRGFQPLKPTISLGKYKYCSKKRNAILGLIKPLSLLFSQTQRGKGARTEAAPSFMKGRCGGSRNTILVYVNH